jgi:hypothetical protein
MMAGCPLGTTGFLGGQESGRQSGKCRARGFISNLSLVYNIHERQVAGIAPYVSANIIDEADLAVDSNRGVRS